MKKTFALCFLVFFLVVVSASKVEAVVLGDTYAEEGKVCSQTETKDKSFICDKAKSLTCESTSVLDPEGKPVYRCKAPSAEKGQPCVPSFSDATSSSLCKQGLTCSFVPLDQDMFDYRCTEYVPPVSLPPLKAPAAEPKKQQKVGICAFCNVVAQCIDPSAPGVGFQCIGGSGNADPSVKRTGYCQYHEQEKKVALCSVVSGTFTEFLNRIANFIFNVAIVLSPILVVYAGFLFLTSAGKPQQVVTARNVLLWTAIGFIVILLSKGLVKVLQGIIGF